MPLKSFPTREQIDGRTYLALRRRGMSYESIAFLAGTTAGDVQRLIELAESESNKVTAKQLASTGGRLN